ncbi:hypothetical protein J4E91_011218 [Alternaria rosae]|nr:hypothetical protein J4E91_011218 [Alternaria rosae]
MSLTNMVMTADPEKAEQEAGGPVQSRRESAEEYKPSALPFQQALSMTSGNASDPKPADGASSLISHESEIVYNSKQFITRNDRRQELGLAQVDIKARLNEKQRTDFGQRKAERRERTGQEAEMDNGEEPASAGAVVESIDWDNFDIDIYDD